MTSVSGSSLSVSFEYDGDGKRVKSTITSRSTTTTVYIGDNFEWTGSTSTMKRYYYAGQTRIAMRTGSLLNWLFGD